MSTREVDDLGAHWVMLSCGMRFRFPHGRIRKSLHEEKYLTRLRPENVSLMILGSTISIGLSVSGGIRPHVIDFHATISIHFPPTQRKIYQ